jgi:hypothetical protein
MNTMKLTLGQASKHAGRAKGTLSKALKNGQITAEKDGKGRWQIDPSELQRWMDANPLRNTTEIQGATPMETPVNPNRNSALSGEVEALRQQLATADLERTREREQLSDRIESLQRMLDDEKSERRQLTALLTDQSQKPAVPQRKGFWARLVG